MTSVSGRSPIELTGPLNAPRRFPFRLFRAPDTSLGLDSPNEPSGGRRFGATSAFGRAASSTARYWLLARLRRRSRPDRSDGARLLDRTGGRRTGRCASRFVRHSLRLLQNPMVSQCFPRRQAVNSAIMAQSRSPTGPTPKNAAGTGWEVSCGCTFACNKILHHFGRVRARAWIVLTQGMNSHPFSDSLSACREQSQPS